MNAIRPNGRRYLVWLLLGLLWGISGCGGNVFTSSRTIKIVPEPQDSEIFVDGHLAGRGTSYIRITDRKQNYTLKVCGPSGYRCQWYKIGPETPTSVMIELTRTALTSSLPSQSVVRAILYNDRTRITLGWRGRVVAHGGTLIPYEPGVQFDASDSKQPEAFVEAIRTFQMQQGLMVDGMLGPRTWQVFQTRFARRSPSRQQTPPPAGAEEAQVQADQ